MKISKINNIKLAAIPGITETTDASETINENFESEKQVKNILKPDLFDEFLKSNDMDMEAYIQDRDTGELERIHNLTKSELNYYSLRGNISEEDKVKIDTEISSRQGRAKAQNVKYHQDKQKVASVKINSIKVIGTSGGIPSPEPGNAGIDNKPISINPKNDSFDVGLKNVNFDEEDLAAIQGYIYDLDTNEWEAVQDLATSDLIYYSKSGNLSEADIVKVNTEISKRDEQRNQVTASLKGKACTTCGHHYESLQRPDGWVYNLNNKTMINIENEDINTITSLKGDFSFDKTSSNKIDYWIKAKENLRLVKLAEISNGLKNITAQAKDNDEIEITLYQDVDGYISVIDPSLHSIAIKALVYFTYDASIKSVTDSDRYNCLTVNMVKEKDTGKVLDLDKEVIRDYYGWQMLGEAQ